MQLHLFGFVEVRRDPLACQSSIGLFDIGGVFSEDRNGEIFLGFARRPLHETTPLCGMEQHGIPVVHTCLFPTFVGTGELVLLHVRGRWKLLVDDGLCWVGSDSSLLVCRDQLRSSFRPWAAVVITDGVSSLMSRPGGLSPTSHQALRWTISFYHQQHLAWSSRTSWSSRTVEWFGLPRSRHP